MKRRFLIVTLIISTLFLSGCGKQEETPYQVDLVIWGAFDSSDAFDEAIKAYKSINENVSVTYRKVTTETYEKDLLSALASGNGPDIFMINNTRLPSMIDVMEPMPAILSDTSEFNGNFVDTVSQDFVSEGKIFALPLSVDSMALYYNKNLFNMAGITYPPKTWQEFDEDVKKLTKYDETGNIIQSGAAIGTAENINRFSDLLSTLMMQNNVQMVGDNHASCTMANKTNIQGGEQENPGKNALEYYTQFSNPDLAMYTWNDSMHYSIDAFSEGKVAMMFNYSWHMDTIQKKDAKLSFDVAPIPQVNDFNQMTYANYWGFGVSKLKNIPPSRNSKKPAGDNSARIHEAWQFLKFLTMKNDGTFAVHNAYSKSQTQVPVSIDPAKSYLEKTKRPAARRDLIESQKNDPRLGVFAKGNIIAKTWYQNDALKVGDIFSNMVTSVTRSGIGAEESVSKACTRITETMR